MIATFSFTIFPWEICSNAEMLFGQGCSTHCIYGTIGFWGDSDKVMSHLPGFRFWWMTWHHMSTITLVHSMLATKLTTYNALIYCDQDNLNYNKIIPNNPRLNKILINLLYSKIILNKVLCLFDPILHQFYSAHHENLSINLSL